MNKNNRAGLIPKNVLKNILTLSAATDPWDSTWDCELLVKIAGKSCGSFYTCSDCIDYTINWFYGEEPEVVLGAWIESDHGSYMCSNCGEDWVLNEGTPHENHMYYCPNCGVPMDLEPQIWEERE